MLPAAPPPPNLCQKPPETCLDLTPDLMLYFAFFS